MCRKSQQTSRVELQSQDSDSSYDSEDSERGLSPIRSANREANLQAHREREALLREGVQTAEQEIRQINEEAAEARRQLDERARLQREAARIRAARRAFMEKLRARKAADQAGNPDNQPPPSGGSTA